jgi:hypothetical protein
MPLVTECPSCAIRIKGISDQQADQAIECPRCHDSFIPTYFEVERATSSGRFPRVERSAHVPPAPALVPPNVWALAALIFGSFAFVTGAAEILHFIAVGLSFLSLFCAVVGLQRRITLGGGWRLPLAGFAVSLPAVIITVFWPALLGVRPRDSGLTAPILFPDQETLAVRAGGEQKGEEPAWAIAGQVALRQGDARIRVTSVRIMALDTQDRVGTRSHRNSLVIGVLIRNMGASKVIPFSGWGSVDAKSDQPLPSLTDGRDRAYQLLQALPSKDFAGSSSGAMLAPGKEATEMLVFEAPAGDVQTLHLELPAAAFGGGGGLRWEIPASMLGRQGTGGGAAQ